MNCTDDQRDEIMRLGREKFAFSLPELLASVRNITGQDVCTIRQLTHKQANAVIWELMNKGK